MIKLAKSDYKPWLEFLAKSSFRFSIELYRLSARPSIVRQRKPPAQRNLCDDPIFSSPIKGGGRQNLLGRRKLWHSTKGKGIHDTKIDTLFHNFCDF